MARNVELKARVPDLPALRERVQGLGGAGPEHLAQVDTFFNVRSGRLKLRVFGDGTGELIGYERPDLRGPKVSEYLRTPVPDPAVLREILTRSLGVRAVVHKRRAVFLVGQTRIHLDDVDGLGSFVELEVVLREDQSSADGERVALSVMRTLGVSPSDLIDTAYADLLREPAPNTPRDSVTPESLERG